MRVSKYRIPFFAVLLMLFIGAVGWLLHPNRSRPVERNENDSIDIAEPLSARPEFVQARSGLGLPVPANKSNGEIAELGKKTNAPADLLRSLSDDVVRYMAAPDGATQCAIANKVASSHPHLLESCALTAVGLKTIHFSADLPLAHFVSVYFHRGPKEKQELISLLQSNDLHLVRGLLMILQKAGDLDEDGNTGSKPLGGPELLPYISQIAKAHPSLSGAVAQALAGYDELARSEIATLLWMVLSPNEAAVLYGKLSLVSVDEELIQRFGLEGDGPLNQGQRNEILNYIRDLDKVPAKSRFRRFSIGLPWVGAILNRVYKQNPDNSGASCTSLYGDIVRYRLAKDGPARAAIAAGVASSRTNLWESCALRVFYSKWDSVDETALAHFVSAYFKRGQKEKQELFSLLQTRDAQIVHGLLWLLSASHDLDSNGELQTDKPLGGTEIPPYISKAARLDPEVADWAVSTLGSYGPFAKSEIATILREILSDRKFSYLSFPDAIRALQKVDPEGLYSKLSLDPDKTLTNKQRFEIEAYLQSYGQK